MENEQEIVAGALDQSIETPGEMRSPLRGGVGERFDLAELAGATGNRPKKVKRTATSEAVNSDSRPQR